MKSWLFGRAARKRLAKDIEAYRRKLASSELVTADEAIACHAALLLVTKDREQRIRSIQTLASLGSNIAIVAAIKELVSLGQRWPNDIHAGDWARVLIEVLRDSSLMPTTE